MDVQNIGKSVSSKDLETLKAARVQSEMEARQMLRKMRRNLDEIDLARFWVGVTLDELLEWSKKELRIACAARELPQDGSKQLLIDRLMRAAHRDRKRIERTRIINELKHHRENEALGTVYCVGEGYGEQYMSWDRLYVRNNLTVLQAMCGKGVNLVRMGYDSTVTYAVCDDGDIWSWGPVRSDEVAPLGYERRLNFRARGERAGTFQTVQHVRSEDVKVGNTPAQAPAIPLRRPTRRSDKHRQEVRYSGVLCVIVN